MKSFLSERGCRPFWERGTTQVVGEGMFEWKIEEIGEFVAAPHPAIWTKK